MKNQIFNLASKGLLSLLFVAGLSCQTILGMDGAEFAANVQIINNSDRTVLLGRGDMKTGLFKVVRYPAGKAGSTHQMAHSNTKDVFIATSAGIFGIHVQPKALTLYDLIFDKVIKNIDLAKQNQEIKITINKDGTVSLSKHVTFAE